MIRTKSLLISTLFLAKRVGDQSPLSVAKPLPKEIDMTGRSRANDRGWKPDWILKKYVGD